MAQTPNINAPQAGILAAVREIAPSILLPQAQIMVPYNIPADNINVTYSDFNIAYRRTAQQMPITQATIMAVVRGKIDNPKITAWTYTLDGHDYYILKLGTYNKTLVYDLTTGTWSWWSSLEDDRWRASTGMNWRSADKIPFNYGSNVIVGDDSYGVLWVLDPEKGMDDDLLEDDLEIPYPRVATGQITTKDRNFIPIYEVDLSCSLGNPSYTLNSVKLEYSDDQGRTYTVADDIKQAVAGNYDQEFTWYSLGLVRAPGRLFRISDDGAFARIDTLTVNE